MWGPTNQNNTHETFRQELHAAYLSHREIVLQAAYRIIGIRDVAEDILQTVFLRLVERPEIQTEFCRNPKAYLYKAAMNEAFNIYRIQKRQKLLAGDIETLEIAEPE